MSPAERLSINQICPIDNRGLSQLQRAILEYLATKVDDGKTMQGFARTGEIVDALGRRRNKAGFASVSRSLQRLHRADLVLAWPGPFSTRGMGYYYSLNRPPAL